MLPPPPPHTRPQNQAIIKSGYMRTYTPRQLPRSPTSLPSLPKWSSSSGRTWPRLPQIPMHRTGYVAQVPAIAQAPKRSPKPKAELPFWPPRGSSPMGHLPYPEDMVGIKAEGQHRDPSVLQGGAQSPSQRECEHRHQHD